MQENIDLAAETIRYVNEPGMHRGGVYCFLDNEKAFDRVQWPFLQEAMKAFGFPDEFRGVVATLYAGVTTYTKVNSHVSQPWQVTGSSFVAGRESFTCTKQPRPHMR